MPNQSHTERDKEKQTESEMKRQTQRKMKRERRGREIHRETARQRVGGEETDRQTRDSVR